MSFKSDVTGFERSVGASLDRLDRVSKLSEARERRALAGRVSVTYARKSQSHKEIHGLLTQILRVAGGSERPRELAPLARRLRRCCRAGSPGSDYLRAVADLAESAAMLDKHVNKYDPNQPRDPETGEWVEAGGSSGSAAPLPTKTASGIKDAVAGAFSGSVDKLVSGARAVRESVGEAVTSARETLITNPSAITATVEATILAAAVAFFFYFQRSATAMQTGLMAVDLGLKALRFLRRIP